MSEAAALQSAVEVKKVPLSSIRFNEAVYPRKEGHNPATVERYAQDIEAIEAAGALITIAADGDLLDGRHRHLGYQTRYADEPHREIPVRLADVKDQSDKLLLAVQLNSRHGLAFSEADRQHAAIALFWQKVPNKSIAAAMSVSEALVSKWLSRTRKEQRDEQNDRIKKLWLACYTYEEIARMVGIEAVGNTAVQAVTRGLKACDESSRTEDSSQETLKDYHATDFEPPLYNVWKQQDKTNAVGHHGNTEARWVDNLLYLYTQTHDIVVDPFAGGGSTIDVCKKRQRRYWCGDRNPIVSRHADNEVAGIRQHDLIAPDGKVALPDLNNRWSEVKLVYLDPPYWKQAEGKYSQEPTDLANMDLPSFTGALAAIITACGGKLQPGAVIALMLQPTQWSAPQRQYTDHVADMIRAVDLPLDLRVQCPYESQQATAQMVDWAKANRKLLVLSRELVIWRVV